MTALKTRLQLAVHTPTTLELSILYVLIGFLIAINSDSAVPLYLTTFYLTSTGLMGLWILFRLLLLGVSYKKWKKVVWGRWIQAGLIVLIFRLICFDKASFYFRVMLSEQALKKEADMMLAMDPNRFEQRRTLSYTVGYFSVTVTHVDFEKRCVWFETMTGEALDWTQSLYGGIVYCESGEPEILGESSYRHMWGPWWRWALDV